MPLEEHVCKRRTRLPVPVDCSAGQTWGSPGSRTWRQCWRGCGNTTRTATAPGRQVRTGVQLWPARQWECGRALCSGREQRV